MTAEPDREHGDPLRAAAEAFEEHERDLLDEVMARIQRDIPGDATVGEAIEEMQRAMLEDEDAQELLFRTALLQNRGSGYIRTRFEGLAAAQSEDLHIQYTTARPMSEEALNLMTRLGDEVEKRLPSGLSEAEREARVVELLREDEELAELASRLERLLPPAGPTDEDEPL